MVLAPKRVPLFLFVIALLSGGCAAQVRSESQAALQDSSVVMDHQRDFYVTRKGLRGGYELIFHIMPAPEGEGYSRSYYHLMVNIRRDGRVVNGVDLYSEVRHPDGSTTPRAAMMKMGDWYMARYNLSHEQGRHWLLVSFTHRGKKYEEGIYYPEIDFTFDRDGR
ncbi:MAG: hypothetical protein Q9M13_07575 [Mariprofundales bacterium]|nr:hypothetical protein [Mariprofundales bacterium]